MAEENARNNEFGRVKTDLVKVVTKNPKKTSFYACKLAGVVLCITALLLTEYAYISFNFQPTFRKFTQLREAAVFIALYGYPIINIILSISTFVGDQLPKKMLLMFAISGAIMCSVAGVLLMVEVRFDQENYFDNYILPYQNRDHLMPSGICALFAAATFAIDTVLTLKYA